MTEIITQREAYKLMFKEYPDLLSIDQTSKMLGISTKTAYVLLREGKIDHLKVGRAYRIPKVNVIKYLRIGNKSSGK